MEINQEIGNREGIAASLHRLGLIADKVEQPNHAFNLMTLSNCILTQIPYADVKPLQSDLAMLVTEQQYTEEQLQELTQHASEAYLNDGGKKLIENALASLREIDE